ncbi:MAG: oligosaccharide flippase family protein [Scytonematopsis contorta HA4267-MV1]|jgi:O-antigen/teichoic acid export membrane protein|nr:oligosaccharide flippase family protein [Scytonematopsis contorta HA4267-MV1]
MTLKFSKNSQSLSLRRNFSWTFAGNLIYAGCQWGMLVLLAKLGTPEMVGRFTLGLAVTAPIILFSNLNLRAVQVTDAKQQYSFGDYLALRLITTVLAVAVISGLGFVGGYNTETLLVILLIGLAKGIESISDIFYGLLQQHEQMDRVAKSMILKGLLSLIALGIGVHLTGSVVWGTVALVATWVFVLLSYDLNSSKLITRITQLQADSSWTPEKQSLKLSLRWDFATLMKLSRVGLPLGVVMMLISLNSNIPRYFIEQSLGQKELGIFAAIAYLQVAGTTVVLALGQSASPRLAKYYASGESLAFRNLLLKLVAIGFVMGVGGVLFAVVGGKQILTLLYQAEYAKHTGLFIWLMVAAGIGYVASFLGFGMTAAQYYRTQLPLFTVVTGAIAISSIHLIQPYKLQGTGIVFVIGAIVQLVGSLAIVIHALNKLNKSSKRIEKI